MNENKQSLKTYLSDHKKSREGKGKGEYAKVAAAPTTRKKSTTKRVKSSLDKPHDQLPNVTPPPELGENINA